MKRVGLKFWIEVPDDTDAARVAEVAQAALNDDDGLLCQWGDWLPGPVELDPITSPEVPRPNR